MPLITTERNYEYEVAFSFLQEDESLAFQIRDLIADRLTTFIYSEHQKKLAGTNGGETFAKVFGEEARIVVVLYREAWGTTTWTGVEETAIKRRTLEESADFTVFISLDGNKPKWLSKLQLWYDFNRFGIKPVAAIIEKKVNEYGGVVREESLEDMAARHIREIDRRSELKLYLRSSEAYDDAQVEAQKLIDYAKSNIDKIRNSGKSFEFSIETFPQFFGCWNLGLRLAFHWESDSWDKVLDESFLVVSVGEATHSERLQRKITALTEEKYCYTVNETKTKGWLNESDELDFKTSEQLVNWWQKQYLEAIREKRNKF